jgi:hypothetical protein
LAAEWVTTERPSNDQVRTIPTAPEGANYLTAMSSLPGSAPRVARIAKKSAQDARAFSGEGAGNAYCFFTRSLFF